MNYEFPAENGGVENTCFFLLREYAKNPELQIDFVTASIDGQYHQLKFGDNIDIHRLPLGKGLENAEVQTRKNLALFAKNAYAFSKRLAEQNSYDLLQANSLSAVGKTAWKLGRKFKLPYVVILDENDIATYGRKNGISEKITSFYLQKALLGSAFVIANTQALKDAMLNLETKKEILIVRNGVDVDQYFPNQAARNPNLFTIVCASQITPMQGVRFLIQAFRLLSVRFDQLRLLVVGDGNERKSLEDLVRALGIKDKVEFTGEVATEKMLACYHKANVVVSPALENRTDNGVLEALACGLPLIATANHDTKEILTDGENVLFVATKDSNQLAEKIEKLILDEKLTSEIAKNGLLLAQQFSWANIAKQYLNVYLETKNRNTIQRG